MKKMYAVTVREEYLRDCQIYLGYSFSDESTEENWGDFNPTHFVGIYEATKEREAIELASDISWFSPEILEAVFINDIVKKQLNILIPEGQISIDEFL